MGSYMSVSIVERDGELIPWEQYAGRVADKKRERFGQDHQLSIRAGALLLTLWKTPDGSGWVAALHCGDDVVTGQFEPTVDPGPASRGDDFGRKLVQEVWVGLMVGIKYWLVVGERPESYWVRIRITFMSWSLDRWSLGARAGWRRGLFCLDTSKEGR